MPRHRTQRPSKPIDERTTAHRTTARPTFLGRPAARPIGGPLIQRLDRPTAFLLRAGADVGRNARADCAKCPVATAAPRVGARRAHQLAYAPRGRLCLSVSWALCCRTGSEFATLSFRTTALPERGGKSSRSPWMVMLLIMTGELGLSSLAFALKILTHTDPSPR